MLMRFVVCSSESSASCTAAAPNAYHDGTSRLPHRPHLPSVGADEFGVSHAL
ncbi:hypothetical protein HNQ95_001374 [Aminobacter ciceronei]|uniref:Uncharacterized protein n=2 Tax=Aminobacter TaxID=31988 RepID=A0AAC9AQG1_AMIAI|nr:hypothetical protein AA2016_1449 [Aminobacter aminovorans]MBA8905605.1 hypothetical protein [Aminobacter ciceronei]MBA9019384.1 hypothetical protein [Aminobacter ciceronei]